jgi:hypothetical protein
MKHVVLGGLAATLTAGALIAAPPPASAGCQYGGTSMSRCDGPIQPDGTWQRCVVTTHLIANGASSFLVPDKRCDVMGPDQHPGGLGFADPPVHIDD